MDVLIRIGAVVLVMLVVAHGAMHVIGKLTAAIAGVGH